MVNVANTKWVLTEWPNQKIPITTKKALLNFTDKNSISRTSFCNVFGGTVFIKGKSIKFYDLNSTMMYCGDIGESEGNFIEALRMASSYQIVDGNLQLLKDEVLLMKFNKTK